MLCEEIPKLLKSRFNEAFWLGFFDLVDCNFLRIENNTLVLRIKENDQELDLSDKVSKYDVLLFDRTFETVILYDREKDKYYIKFPYHFFGLRETIKKLKGRWSSTFKYWIVEGNYSSDVLELAKNLKEAFQKRKDIRTFLAISKGKLKISFDGFGGFFVNDRSRDNWWFMDNIPFIHGLRGKRFGNHGSKRYPEFHGILLIRGNIILEDINSINDQIGFELPNLTLHKANKFFNKLVEKIDQEFKLDELDSADTLIQNKDKIFKIIKDILNELEDKPKATFRSKKAKRDEEEESPKTDDLKELLKEFEDLHSQILSSEAIAEAEVEIKKEEVKEQEQKKKEQKVEEVKEEEVKKELGEIVEETLSKAGFFKVIYISFTLHSPYLGAKREQLENGEVIKFKYDRTKISNLRQRFYDYLHRIAFNSQIGWIMFSDPQNPKTKEILQKMTEILDELSNYTGAFRSITLVEIAIPKSFFVQQVNSYLQYLKQRIENISVDLAMKSEKYRQKLQRELSVLQKIKKQLEEFQKNIKSGVLEYVDPVALDKRGRKRKKNSNSA